MVLRKSPPPRIDVSGRGHPLTRARSNSSASNSFNPSPKRAERRRYRADSVSSEKEAVYSPDLHTSPAFDLQTLEEAQKSPWGSPLSAPDSPWPEEGWEQPEHSTNYHPACHRSSYDDPRKEQKAGLSRVPPIVMAGTARRQAAELAEIIRSQPASADETSTPVSPHRFKSNNPFLKSRNQSPHSSDIPNPSHDQHVFEDQTLSPNHPYGNHQSQRSSQGSSELVTIAADLSIIDQSDAFPTQQNDIPGANDSSRPPGSYNEYRNATSDYMSTPGPSVPADNAVFTPLPPQSEPPHAAYHQPIPRYEHSVTPLQVQENHSNTSSGQGSNFTPNSSEDLIDLNETPRVQQQPSFERQLALDDSEYVRVSESEPPQLPPSIPTLPPLSEAERKRQAEQQAETYSIRHITWTDYTGRLRESPVLIQNKNGPCPLLALVNALVIRSDRDNHPPIVKALMTRETISLGLLIQALFDELTTYVGVDEELPDIEALSRFLTMLHTGMNVNPRLTLEHESFPGSFLETNDLRLYGSFRVPLLHGWVASPSSRAHAAMNRVAQYFEDIQLLQFRKEELEHSVSQGRTLTPDEQQLIRDIDIIISFVDVENPTQLTWFGLDQLNKVLQPGSVSILFRNDHFTTLYKHPQSHQLFSLITDAGYATHAEIVWESLADVKGSGTDFFSGDFLPVSHESTTSNTNIAGQRSSSLPNAGPSTQQHNEQTDADYAYALSLQFQEEAQREDSRSRPTQSQQQGQPLPQPRRSPSPRRWVQPSSSVRGSLNQTSRISSGSNRHSSSTSHRRDSSRQSTNDFPPLPSRREQDSGPTTVQPSFDPRNDAAVLDDAPPPSYEQVARNKALEAQGVNPGSLTDPFPDNRRRASSTSAGPSYGQQQRYQNSTPSGRRPPGGHSYSTSTLDRPRPKDKDCVVM